MPPWASGPTFTVRSPILIGVACAVAGAGYRPSPAATPSRVDIIVAAHREADAVAFGHDDRCRPNFQVKSNHFAGPKRLLFTVRVIRPIWCRCFFIELAVRSAQPALADRRVRIDGALKYYFLHVRRKHAQYDENIGIAGR